MSKFEWSPETSLVLDIIADQPTDESMMVVVKAFKQFMDALEDVDVCTFVTGCAWASDHLRENIEEMCQGCALEAFILTIDKLSKEGEDDD